MPVTERIIAIINDYGKDTVVRKDDANAHLDKLKLKVDRKEEFVKEVNRKLKK